MQVVATAQRQAVYSTFSVHLLRKVLHNA